MRCAEFERRLQDLLDADPRNSLSPESLPSSLSTHTQKCTGCEKLLTGYRSMFVGLAALSKARNAEKKITRAPARSKNRSRTQVIVESFGWYAAAACIVAMVTFTSMRHDPASKLASAAGDSPVAFVGTSLVTPQAETELGAIPPSELEQSVITEGFILDPRRLDLEPASLGMVLNLAGFRPVTFSAEVLETHWNRQPAWLVEVADGLKPVTESMTDALKRVLPATTSEEPNQGARYNRFHRFEHLA